MLTKRKIRGNCLLAYQIYLKDDPKEALAQPLKFKNKSKAIYLAFPF